MPTPLQCLDAAQIELHMFVAYDRAIESYFLEYIFQFFVFFKMMITVRYLFSLRKMLRLQNLWVDFHQTSHDCSL
jgi:hypothetical protein